jgi:hypothetical protein
MTGMNSRPINQRYVRRQPTEPGRQLDGMTWINPSGGASGNNSERYTFNGDSDTWELFLAVGPDSPDYAVDGSLWSDTGAGESKVYDASVPRWQPTKLVRRQTTEPSDPVDGMRWIDPSAGSTGSNTEHYTYNGTSWDLSQAFGADTPSNAVDGSLWSDTGAGETKFYDAGAAAWSQIGINRAEAQEAAAMWSGGYAPGFGG